MHKVIYLLDYLHCINNLRYATWVIRDGKIHGYLEFRRVSRINEKMKQHGIQFTRREWTAVQTVEELLEHPYTEAFKIGEIGSFVNRTRTMYRPIVYAKGYCATRVYTRLGESVTTSPMPEDPPNPLTTSIREENIKEEAPEEESTEAEQDFQE